MPRQEHSTGVNEAVQLAVTESSISSGSLSLFKTKLSWHKNKQTKKKGGWRYSLASRPTLLIKTAFFHAVLCQGCSSCGNPIATKSAGDTNLRGQWADRIKLKIGVEWPGGSWGCRQCLGDSVPINICLNTHEELDIWTSEHVWYYGVSSTEWGD